MSTQPGPDTPEAVAAWAEGRQLRRVEFDLDRAAIRLDLGEGSVSFRGVAAATLLGPWDGRAGRVEWLRVVDRDEGAVCLELRLDFGAVPRVYRVVCADLLLEPGPLPGSV